MMELHKSTFPPVAERVKPPTSAPPSAEICPLLLDPHPAVKAAAAKRQQRVKCSVTRFKCSEINWFIDGPDDRWTRQKLFVQAAVNKQSTAASHLLDLWTTSLGVGEKPDLSVLAWRPVWSITRRNQKPWIQRKCPRSKSRFDPVWTDSESGSVSVRSKCDSGP